MSWKQGMIAHQKASVSSDADLQLEEQPIAGLQLSNCWFW